MNLVQTQYHLRDLPDAAIKAFADGRDPATVPEWLAAAEMQRRQRLEMSASKAPQKSVKERLEETMGLKTLQAQRQQQASQQMAEQAMSLPTIPENVPQPEEQPQEAASGGLMSGIAKLPVEMFHQAAYAGGGIVAFDGGGDVDNARKWANFALSGRGVTSPAYEELIEQLRKPEETIETPEQIIAKRKALLSAEGVGLAGAGQEERMRQREADYEKEKKSRALDNLIKSMAIYGRPNIFGKGQGSDYANTAVQGFEAARQEDTRFRDAQDKLRDAIETQRRADLIGNVDLAQKAVEDQKKAKAEMARARLTAMSQAAQTEATKATAGLGYLGDLEKMKSAERIAALSRIPDVVKTATWLMEKDPSLSREDALRMGAEISNTGRLEAVDAKRAADADKAFKEKFGPQITLANLEKDPAKKQKMLDDLDVEKRKIYAEHKVKGVETAPSGGGTTRIKLDANGNIVK